MIAKKHKKEIFDGGNRKQMRLTLRGAREKKVSEILAELQG
jgi:hypothetical protein